jgi:hypothetical protein
MINTDFAKGDAVRRKTRMREFWRGNDFHVYSYRFNPAWMEIRQAFATSQTSVLLADVVRAPVAVCLQRYLNDRHGDTAFRFWGFVRTPRGYALKYPFDYLPQGERA